MAKDDRKLPTKPARADIDAFLRKVAMAPAQARGEGRLIFAMDATASREPTWDMACQLQGQMFAETGSIGALSVQLAYYRGFGAFEKSAGMKDAKALIDIMTGVFCLGGRTQIDKVLRHAIAETRARKVSALVFVGDCMEEDVDELCDLAGELGMLGVPAFLFQEGHDPVAERAFRQMATLTKGAYCRFDQGSAQQLRELLSAVAVYAVGGRLALENYSKRAGAAVLKITRQVK